MEDTTLDETESVPKRDTKSRRSSILKQRTPLQAIAPNPRRVTFSVKQTKEFHSAEAPFVLGSSYEETFQSDSPKSSHESHFTMTMLHSATTPDIYSDKSNEANIFWHEELHNTTHFANVNSFESSESECEVRMSIDAEVQHCSIGIEDVAPKSGQGNVNWNEQVDNVENLTPELLNHFIKKQKIQASQIPSLSDNRRDHKIEKSVNISGCNTRNTKVNVYQHHSSETVIEYSFPNSDMVKNDGMWSSVLIPRVLNRSEKKEFSRGALPKVNGNESSKMTKHTSQISNELVMDADMDFTDVVHTNRPCSGSRTSHANSAMDLTEGIFCRETNSNNDNAQGHSDLDESEIEFTNTVGHIVASESEDTFSKISGIKMLKSDGSSTSDFVNTQKASTKCMHEINAHYLQPSNAAMQSTTNLASAVDSYKINTVASTILEKKNSILEKDDTYQMHLGDKKKKDINDMALKFVHDCHTEFIDAVGSRAMEDVSRTNKMNENNLELIAHISSANHAELTHASYQQLAREISQISQMESINVEENKSNAKISDDSQLEFTGILRCNSPTKDTDDIELEFTNVAVCKPALLADNISSNVQINNDPANDSQMELTGMIHCKSVAKVTDISDKKLSEVNGYSRVDTNLYEINLDCRNTNSDEVNSSEHHSVPASENYNDSDFEFTKLAAYKPAEIANISSSKETYCHVNEQTEESQLESTGLKLSDSTLEFTEIVKHTSSVEHSNSSHLEFTNITGRNQLTECTESRQKITGLMQNIHAKDSDDNELEFTNLTTQTLFTKDFDDSKLEFTNKIRQKVPAKGSGNSQEVFTNSTMQKSLDSLLEFSDSVKPNKLAAKIRDVSELEITNIAGQKLLIKANDVSEQDITNIVMKKLPTKASDGCELEPSSNKEQKLPEEYSDDSQPEFTNIVNHKVITEDTNVNQLEITDISRKPATKHSGISQLEFTNLTTQTLFTKDVDDSQLEFTNNIRQKLPTKGSDNSQVEFTDSTMQKSLAKDSGDSQLELSNSVKHNKLPAKIRDFSQLEFTNIAGQKMLTKDNGINQLDITNITMQKQYVEASGGSELGFSSNTELKLPEKYSNDSQLEFTNIVGHKLIAEDTHPNQMEFTDLTTQTLFTKDFDDSELEFTYNIRQKVPAKDFDNSQVVFTNSTMQKSLAKDSVDNLLEFTDSVEHSKLAARIRDVSQLEITNIAGQKLLTKDHDVSELDITNNVMQKQPTKASDGSELGFSGNLEQKLPEEHSNNTGLEFTNIVSHKVTADDTNVNQLKITDISQKPATNHSGISQLEFTNLTTQTLFTKDFDDSKLEFTNNTKLKLLAKKSDNTQVEFTNNTMQKSLAKDPVDSGLEFTDSVKHNKLAAKIRDTSQLEFTNIEVQNVLTKDTDINQLDITNTVDIIQPIQKQYAKDSDDAHLEFIDERAIVPVKNSADSQLEFTINTSNKPFAKDSDGQLEVTNIIAQKLPAKVADDSQFEYTDNTSQKLPKHDSNDSVYSTDKTRQKYLTKDFDDSQMQFTNTTKPKLAEKYTGHSAPSKDSVGSQLEFTGSAVECIPSIKHSVDVELEFTTCIDINNCSKEVEAIHLEHTLDCLKMPNELKLKTTARKEEGNCDQIDSDTRLEPALEFSNKSCIPTRETVDNTSNPNVDEVVVLINSDVSKKMLSHKKADINNESVDPYKSQLELTEIAPLKATTNISTNSYSKRAEEMDQFSLRAVEVSQLDLTNVVGNKQMAELYETKTVKQNGNESTKVIEKDKCIESSVTIDITNGIQCRKNPQSLMELSDIKSHPEYSYVEKTRNVNESIDITELGSNLCTNRKRNINDLNFEHSNDCELECSNTKYFKSAERAGTQRTGTTELKNPSPQHIDVTTAHHASNNQKDMANAVNNSLAFGVPGMNLDVSSNNDTMEFSNNQSYVTQISDSMEFSACAKDINKVSKNNLLQEESQLQSHLEGLKIDNSEQEISQDSDVSQSSTTVNPHLDDITRKKILRVKQLFDISIEPDETFLFNSCTDIFTLSEVATGKQHVAVGPDEAFTFNSYSDTFVLAEKLQLSKKLNHFYKSHTNASSHEIVQLDTVSENATYKIQEEVKDNQKQNIEHMQAEDINLHYEPGYTSLLEDESIVLNDESSYNLEQEDEAQDNLIKTIWKADRSIFSSLGTVSPGTALSGNSDSPAAANTKEELVKEIHPNQEQNKKPKHNTEPEMIEVEGNFTNGQLPKIHDLEQSSSMSETKMEMSNMSVETDLLCAAVSSVEQAEMLMCFSNSRVETEEITDIKASGKEKETVQLSNFTLSHIELNCRESVVQGKTEQVEDDVALNMDQSCVAVVQKPLSLEEWLKSRKHEWDVKELSDIQWSFLFLYKSLGLVLKLDATNETDGMKYISDIVLESYLAKKSTPETHFVHHILLQKLSPQNLKAKFKVTADVPELMNIISKAVTEMKLFLKDFFLMETCKLMEIKNNRVSFKMSDMRIHSVFRVSVNLSNWGNIKPEDVTVEDLMGTINKKEVQNLVNAVPKGPTFLSEYVDIIREYISVLRKK